MKNKNLKIKKQSKISLIKQNLNTLKVKFTPIEVIDDDFVIQTNSDFGLYEVSFTCPCCDCFVSVRLYDSDVKLKNVMCPCCGQTLHSYKLDML